MMKTELTAFRRRLEKMIRRLSEEDSRLRHEFLHEDEQGLASGAAEQQESSEDIGREGTDDEIALSLLSNEEDLLKECRSALERIDRGVFGKCVKCHKPIPIKRLVTAPYARLCIGCARSS